MVAVIKIAFDTDRCKGCGLCVQHCPRNGVTMSDRFNVNGYLLPAFDEGRCNSCGICAWLCPDLAISIYQ